MERLRLAPMTCAAVVAIALAAPQAARAQATTIHVNQTDPFTAVIDDPCTGEPILFEGTIHTEGEITINDNHTHSQLHTNIHATGIGALTGTEYIFNDVLNNNTNSGDPLPMIVSLEHNTRIISTGPSDNFLANTRIQITINANGEMTVDRVDVDTSCQ